MAIDIFAAASLAFLLIVGGAMVHLLWKVWRVQTLEQLSDFAKTLPEEERVIFWRLHRHRELWNISRYPKAFRKWRRSRSARSAQAHGTQAQIPI
jgi:hypothetical protein